MLSRFARLLLVLTSLAPMAFVYGMTKLPGFVAAGWMAMAALVTGVCFILLRFVKNSGETEILQIERTEMQDKEVLTFLVSYLLPVIKPTNVSVPGLLAFLALVVIVLYQ